MQRKISKFSEYAARFKRSSIGTEIRAPRSVPNIRVYKTSHNFIRRTVLRSAPAREFDELSLYDVVSKVEDIIDGE